MTQGFFSKDEVCSRCGAPLKHGRTVSCKTFETICLACRDKENGELRREAKKLIIRGKNGKNRKN